MKPKKNKQGQIVFAGYPEFRPNKTPKEVFKLGAFGGTYYRPISSKVTKKKYSNQDKEYPKSWFTGIDQDMYVTSSICRPKINRYKVKSGSSLIYWEKKGWIKAQDPYGWFQWYCRFYQGRRSDDDERQIKRWLGIAGDKSRFRNRLIKMCDQKNKSYNDETVSPVIRQLLLQWGYELTLKDSRDYLKKIN